MDDLDRLRPTVLDNSQWRIADVCIKSFQRFIMHLEHVLVDPVVRINKSNVLTLRCLKSTVAGSPQPPILTMNHCNSGISLGKIIGNLPTSVRRSVINKDDLDILEGLVDNTMNTRFKIQFYVVD